MNEKTSFKFWIDCGGTFTDIIAVDERGRHRVEKLLSQSPHYESAVVEGVKTVLGGNIDPERIAEIRLGTTVATNAFLERKGVECGLLTTLGHRDVLEIRQQNRPDLFALDIQKIKPLYKEVAHTKERLDARGETIEPLDEEVTRFELRRLYDEGLRSAAIAFMHSALNPEHELRAKEIAFELGFKHVVCSHETSPLRKYIPRTETSVADAYLTPLLEIYTDYLKKALGVSNILYMQSSGDLCGQDSLRGQNTLLSGPAGGLIGAVKACQRRGMGRVITFDMGGTSTDVALYDGVLEVNNEPEFHGIKLLSPMMDIHTVAAGGGSILKYDGGRFSVGPESAGAFPGPACYRNGGPLTITDANLYLGRLDPKLFPAIFGPEKNRPLDEEIVREKFERLAAETGMSASDVAEGFLEVAANTMARAIKKVSVERGADPEQFVMASFGGAAGQMACKVADAIGIKTVFCHPFSSVLSAYGIGLADEGASAMASVFRDPREWSQKELDGLWEKLEAESLEKKAGLEEFEHILNMRPKGGDYELPVSAKSLARAQERFRVDYKKVFGVEFDGDIEAASAKVVGKTRSGYKEEFDLGGKVRVESGPAVIAGSNTCMVVDRGWRGEKNRYGEWILRREEKVLKKGRAEKVELEIFYQKFQSVAEQMGRSLQRMAASITIKERNDFSCALFSKNGELVANAPHIPVHLGSMGDTVRAVLEFFKDDISPGDSFICNDPNFGGTHLPDITVVDPVFLEGELSMFAASRGHHADIGGISPGSMPGNSKVLEEEGVVISPMRVVRRGKFMGGEIRRLLVSGKWPSRDPELNLGDIKAQLASNQKALFELQKLARSEGAAKVERMCEAILDYSRKKIEETLENINSGQASVQVAPDRLVALRLVKHKDRLTLDFSGTSPSGKHNFNTPVPVVKASVLFALRCLIKENIPLNDGIARYLEFNIPKGSLLNPTPGDAVVAGNVETSQTICDLVFEALEAKAHGQGTMNNVSFGGDGFQYYETLGGGGGASRLGSGADAVQVNMTNSALTDPEIFESRLPARLELMAVRRGSGGKGRRAGGDGIIRKILFLENAAVNMISQRRKTLPKGLAGGESAAPGRQTREREDGELLELKECFQADFRSGERLTVYTPGGGGFGPAERADNIVFAYGSNMDLRQIKKRCPSSRHFGQARLDGFELRYSIYSDARKGGVADTFRAEGKRMFGTLYGMSAEDLAYLDEIECGKGHYGRVENEVVLDNGDQIKVWSYDVNDKDPDVAPTVIYRWLVYSGAYMLGAPNSYLAKI